MQMEIVAAMYGDEMDAAIDFVTVYWTVPYNEEFFKLPPQMEVITILGKYAPQQLAMQRKTFAMR